MAAESSSSPSAPRPRKASSQSAARRDAPRPRNALRSRAAILAAATDEFAANGLGGARVEGWRSPCANSSSATEAWRGPPA